MQGINTHGRWPVIGALGLAPVTAAAVRRPALRPLAALLWHQTEEWVWPGAFLPWMNRTVLGSGQDEFPIDRRMGFIVNVVLGWGGSLAALRPQTAPVPVTTLYVSHLGNVLLHVSWAARHRRYDPGVVTALLTLGPVAAVGLHQLAGDARVSPRAMRVGAVQGLLVCAGLVPMLKLRLRRGL
jgi:Protein of unknown function with HXXEE motif